METRKITLNGWVKSGEGATAVSYNNTEDKHQMLKVFTASIMGPQYAQNEFELSRKVESLGLRTPKAQEIVDCEGFSSIIYERIVHKKSISRLCASEPKEIKRWATLFASECYHLHSTTCESGDFVSRKEKMLVFANGHEGYTDKTKRKIVTLAEELPNVQNCLHGDLQSGNMIVDTNTGTTYWIDLGSFAWGDPMYDLSCLYFFCKHPIGRILGRKLCHLSFFRLAQFWDAFEVEYSRLAGLANLSKKASRYVLLYLVYTLGLQNYNRLVTLAFDTYINHIAAKR